MHSVVFRAFPQCPGLTEVELRAIFLLRLPQFVNWPDQLPAVHICVDPLSEVSGLLSGMVALEPRERKGASH